MSKIIEALKAHNREVNKEINNPEKAEAPREVQVERTGREFTQQQLADIYFSATGKSKALEAPVIIRVVEKPRLASLAPWIISSIAFLITALSLFSTKKIFIDIRVMDEKSPTAVSAEKGEEAPGGTSESAAVAGHKIAFDDVTFEGAASLKSSKDKNGLTLINSSVAPFARATLHLDPPLSLSRSSSKLIFYAKGGHGGENIALALKDRENMQGFIKGKLYPFSNNLTTAWQRAEISLSETTKEFNTKGVTSVHFEFGSKDTDNKPGDTLFIKDLQWIA